jgi:hypothetical protein
MIMLYSFHSLAQLFRPFRQQREPAVRGACSERCGGSGYSQAKEDWRSSWIECVFSQADMGGQSSEMDLRGGKTGNGRSLLLVKL